jgi:hypothetical protein
VFINFNFHDFFQKKGFSQNGITKLAILMTKSHNSTDSKQIDELSRPQDYLSLTQDAGDIFKRHRLIQQDIFRFSFRKIFPFSAVLGAPNYKGMSQYMDLLEKEALLLQRRARTRVKVCGDEEKNYLVALDKCMEHFRKVALSLSAVAKQFAAQHGEGKPPKIKEMYALQGEYKKESTALLQMRGALGDLFRKIPEVVSSVEKVSNEA